MPIVFSVKQVCSELSITPATFYRWRDAGILRPVKIGGRTLVPSEQVKSLVENAPAA